MKPRGIKTLNVLYLFAGRQRRADICACLKVLADEFNACIDFDFGVSLTCREVDIVRNDESDDLISAPLRDKLLKEVLS